MKGDLLVDYAWARPDPAKLRSAGYVAALRYLSNNPPSDGKNISAAERDALFAAGLGLGLVWESTAGRMLQGAQAGHDDGLRANALADAIGFPRTRPIFFACDTDVGSAQFGACEAYLRNAAGVRDSGVYGEFDLIEAMAARGIGWLWQTVAWSGGRVSQRAQLYQRSSKTRPDVGGDYDEDVALADDYGVWFPGTQPKGFLMALTDQQQQALFDAVARLDQSGIEQIQIRITDAIKTEFQWLPGPAVVLADTHSVVLPALIGSIVRIMHDGTVDFHAEWVKGDGSTFATQQTNADVPGRHDYVVPDTAFGVKVTKKSSSQGRLTVTTFPHAVEGDL